MLWDTYREMVLQQNAGLEEPSLVIMTCLCKSLSLFSLLSGQQHYTLILACLQEIMTAQNIHTLLE